MLANPANYLLVAQVRGRLAGFLLAYRLDRLDRVSAQLFVYEIGVLPRFRRHGIGMRLLHRVRDVVMNEGLMEAFVITDRSNAAARALFVRTGATPEAPQSMVFVYPGHAA